MAGLANADRHTNQLEEGDVPSTSLVAIVDDDQSVRLATESLVKSLGHTAVTFASAEAFLESACLERVNCLIADIKMPGMTGVQLQSTLLAQGKHLPIIFITAYRELRIADQVLAAGAVGLLDKPFASSDMILHLVAALERNGAPPT